MKPPVKILWLFAAVMAVGWALVASSLGPLLILGFGRGGGPLRYWGVFIVQAVVVFLVSAHSYREGWKRGRDDQKHLQAGEPQHRSAA